MILTEEQAKALLASLPEPQQCEACSAPFATGDARKVSYGPFTLHVLPDVRVANQEGAVPGSR